MGTVSRVIAVCAALAAGCVESSVVLCGGGRVCPGGTMCVDDLDLCATPQQLSVCQEGGMRGGDPCDAGSVTGLCNRAAAGEPCESCLCLPARCGDGFISAPEVCDGAALGDEPLCNQHGFYEAIEVSCSATCEYDVAVACSRTCGDGVVEPAQGELCDDVIDPADPCVVFGFDAGFTECFAGGCAPDFRTCRRIGWTAALRDSGFFQAMATAEGRVFVAASEGAPSQLVLWTFDGISWSRASTGVMTNPSSMWAAGATDLYVLGTVGANAQLAHFNGTTWSVEMLPAAQARLVWGTASSDVWVFGDAGAARHWNGTSWSAETIANGTSARSAAGSAANDFWLSGSNNRLFHYDGTWTQITTPLTLVYSVASAAGTIYIVGDGGVYRRDGTAWTLLTEAVTGPLIETLWGTSASDLYAIGYGDSSYGVLHYDGARWTNILPNPSGPVAVGGLGPELVLLVRAFGAVERYGGNAWEEATVASTVQFTSVVGASNGDVFVVENGAGVHRYTAGTRVFSSLSTAYVVGHAGTEIYAGGYGGILERWTGSSWQLESDIGEPITAIAGTDESHVFATAGFSIAVRAANGSWSIDALTTGTETLLDLWCEFGGTTCVAVGGTAIKMWNGTSWTTQIVSPSLQAVWGASATDIYAVGLSGAILHFDGASWSTQKIQGEVANLWAISGTAADDIVATTESGQLYHFDGAHWAPIRQRGTGQTLDLWTSANEIWTVGDDIYGPSGTGRKLVLQRTYAW